MSIKFSSVKKHAFILALSFVFNSVFAQVNLQTGSATFTLPMFTWQDNKSRLNSVVALSYNSGNGLKVNDVASNVGQGWNLVAGGVITRMQVGEPDDQMAFAGSGDQSDQDITKYPAGYLYATQPAYNGCPNALAKYPIYGSTNLLYAQHNVIAEDRQLDYFSFQFNGKAGMFIVDNVNGDKGACLADNKMKISFQRDPTMIGQGIRTTITSFTIQDADGLIYRFSIHGLTKILESAYCDDQMTEEQTQPTFDNGGIYHQAGFDNNNISNPFIIGSWYLSEIEDPLTHRKVSFTYTLNNIKNNAGADIAYNFANPNSSDSKEYAIISHRTSISTTPAIASIVYPDGHGVNFNYGNFRVDLKGDRVLSSVDILYNVRFLSEYKLNTSYFIRKRYGTPTSDDEKSAARLCLKSVQKIGVDLKEDSPPYIFTYNLGSSKPDDFVPPPFFYAKDIWGYYNGNNSVGYDGSGIGLKYSLSVLNLNSLKGLCFLNANVPGVYLNANSAYAQNGLLREIIYPTGGTLDYVYEQNRGTLNNTNTMVGGVHVLKTESTDGGYSNGCSTPITTLYNYINEDGASSLWGLETPVNSVTMQSHYAPEYKDYHITFSSLPFGTCYWHFMYPGILSQQQVVSLTDIQKIMQVASNVLGVMSVVSTIMDVAHVIGGSTGFLSWAAVAVDIIGGIITLGISCFHDYSKDNTSTVYYNTDLNTISPLPTQFKRVEIIENPGTIGKTVQEFTCDDQYPIMIPHNPTFSPRQRFTPWSYGLPLTTTIFDANNYITKKIDYDYTNHQHLIEDCGKCGFNPAGSTSPLVSCKCEVKKSYSERDTHWTDPADFDPDYITESTGDMNVDFYDYLSGRMDLYHTYEKIYRKNDVANYVETVTEYNYNDITNYEVNRISTTQSSGEISNKYFTYSSDLSTGVYDILTQNNILSVPVSTKSTINTNNKNGLGYEQTLKNITTDYIQLPNGDIKPSQVKEQRFSAPNTSLPELNIVQSFTYDAGGNLIGSKDEGNHVITNIYDYDDKYVVASVINADPLVDKATYTSFETRSLGGWNLRGRSTSNNSGAAVTGTSTFLLWSQNRNSLSVPGLNTSKPYILSFWTDKNTISINVGATLLKSAPSVNGFTYYEYEIAKGTSLLSISNADPYIDVNIDELRLFPKTARMKTVTYDPLIGKTSECDENNRITYYEYDNLGRLLFIKDENRNVLKMYEYNNISAAKQNGCPGIYYNLPISETFTKANCGAGYIGSDVTYTIPAQRYSSIISQADADVRAENELLKSGPSIADANGYCILLYYNDFHSKTVYTQNCNVGSVGGALTYTVPAKKYSSTISKADAESKALNEIKANAQAYANQYPNAVCLYSTDPDWVADEPAHFYCPFIILKDHQFVIQTDINPNSPTFQHIRSLDLGPSDKCHTTSNSIYAMLSFANVHHFIDGTSYGDVVAKFYSDASCTQPVSVSNLPINYSRRFDYDGGLNSSTIYANGTSTLLESGPLRVTDPQCPDITKTIIYCQLYNYSYELLPGNYVIE